MKVSVPLAILFLVAPTASAVAQPREGRLTAPRLLTAESVLAMRERLALTPEQITRLTGIRREAVAERQGYLARLIELRSELAAGEITGDRFAARIAGDRDSIRARAGARAERIRDILTADQRERLAELRFRRVDWERVGPGRWSRGGHRRGWDPLHRP